MTNPHGPWAQGICGICSPVGGTPSRKVSQALKALPGSFPDSLFLEMLAALVASDAILNPGIL